MRLSCTNNDQARTRVQIWPDLSSVYFHCTNAVQHWTCVELGSTVNSRQSSDQTWTGIQLCLLAHAHKSTESSYQQHHVVIKLNSLDNKINFW